MDNIEINNCETDIKEDINRYDHDIKIMDNCDINYIIFFEDFMSKNIPCIIKNISLAWDCNKNWIRNETINYEYFIEHYGDLEAPVADCDSIDFNSHHKINMKVKEYMNYLQSANKERLLYLKDWHLRRIKPEESFYKVPLFFSSDWLNEFAVDQNEDDFMFVYIGPKKSWTPLHADVYNSYSWSVNVIGRKKWILFPPGEEEKLKDSLGNLPLLFTPEDFPNIKHYEIVQERGEALFVPSGWHHQVENLLDTISINHNWVNGCNIESVWTALNKCLQSVENEIKDLRESPDFITQCQLILKSLFGMDFINFINFVCYTANKRAAQFQENKFVPTQTKIGTNHIIFDLKILLKVMNLIENHYLFSRNNILSSTKKCDFINTKNKILVTLS